jgi:hypothetical protein
VHCMLDQNCRRGGWFGRSTIYFTMPSNSNERSSWSRQVGWADAGSECMPGQYDPNVIREET